MIYFISDAHLGARIIKDSRAHEKKFVDWLDKVKADATVIYMLGDIFDFWFEYKTVVPKGYVRFLGKVAELIDAGIEIHFFTGNHDIWTFGYLEQEIGLIVHRHPEIINLSGKTFYLAHGDGLYVKNDPGFRFIRKIFHSRLAQNLFGLFPPRLGQEFGYRWSKSNRVNHMALDNQFLGEDKEYLVIYSKDYAASHPEIDFFVYGHRHIALDLQIRHGKRIVILGDFMSAFTYGVFDGNDFRLEYPE